MSNKCPFYFETNDINYNGCGCSAGYGDKGCINKDGSNYKSCKYYIAKDVCPYRGKPESNYYCDMWAGVHGCSLENYSDYGSCYYYTQGIKKDMNVNGTKIVYFNREIETFQTIKPRNGFPVYVGNESDCHKFLEKASTIQKSSDFSKEFSYFIHHGLFKTDWEVSRSKDGSYTKDCCIMWFQSESDAWAYSGYLKEVSIEGVEEPIETSQPSTMIDLSGLTEDEAIELVHQTFKKKNCWLNNYFENNQYTTETKNLINQVLKDFTEELYINIKGRLSETSLGILKQGFEELGIGVDSNGT